MKPCPKCGELPLTIGQFVRKFDMRKAKCRNCGTALKGNRILHILFWCAVAVGAWAAGLGIYLEEARDWPSLSGFLLIVGAALVLGIPAEILAWKKGAYLVEPRSDATEEGNKEEPQVQESPGG